MMGGKKRKTETEIEIAVWNDCNNKRIDLFRWKDYTLAMLLFKYLSDASRESGGRFQVDERFSFESVYKSRGDPDIGKKINAALAGIEGQNRDKLHHVFSGVDFDSRTEFGDGKAETLCHLLEEFHKLDLRPDPPDMPATAGGVCERVLSGLAANAGKEGNEFFTPDDLAELTVSLAAPEENDCVYDPVCGSGNLLLKAFRRAANVTVCGQELDARTWALCQMNLRLHGVDNAQIWRGETISCPQNVKDGALLTFQAAVAHLPRRLDGWDRGFLPRGAEGRAREKMTASLDPHGRFDWGIPPSSRGEFAFILHMLHSLDPETGRMAVIVPQGLLSRGSGESALRRRLVELNLLDAVIGLPAGLLFGTRIPICILVFRKSRIHRDVLFIDASAQGNFQRGKNRNLLRTCDIARIVEAYRAREHMNGFSHAASYEEIKQNGFNWSIPRYAGMVPEERTDAGVRKQKIAGMEAELAALREEIGRALNGIENF